MRRHYRVVLKDGKKMTIGVLAEGLAEIYELEGVELTNVSAYIRETQQMYATPILTRRVPLGDEVVCMVKGHQDDDQAAQRVASWVLLTDAVQTLPQRRQEREENIRNLSALCLLAVKRVLFLPTNTQQGDYPTRVPRPIQAELKIPVAEQKSIADPRRRR